MFTSFRQSSLSFYIARESNKLACHHLGWYHDAWDVISTNIGSCHLYALDIVVGNIPCRWFHDLLSDSRKLKAELHRGLVRRFDTSFDYNVSWQFSPLVQLYTSSEMENYIYVKSIYLIWYWNRISLPKSFLDYSYESGA